MIGKMPYMPLVMYHSPRRGEPALRIQPETLPLTGPARASRR
jgi:hypothetical protein